jgi:tripartite-type tricarboxylate transporter receptor subunit TctC
MKDSLFPRLARRLAAPALCALAAGVFAPAAHAAYPEQPIRLVIGFAPGGPTDVILRVVAQEMSKSLGQSVVVENKPGANSMIAACDVARSPADGYVLLGSTLADNVNAILTPATAKCQALRDFQPVGLAVTLPMIAVTAYDSPFRTIGDLVKQAKAAPDSVTYGSAGNGGSAHLAGALLATQSGTQMTHVPFKGNAPALTEVMAGRVNFMFYPMVGIAAQVEQKRLRPLAIMLPKRHPDFPDVPTMSESGFANFEEYAPGVGILAPAGTPVAVRTKLNEAMRAAIAKPEVAKRLAELGGVPAIGSLDDYGAWLKQDYARWERVIKAAGVRAE